MKQLDNIIEQYDLSVTQKTCLNQRLRKAFYWKPEVEEEFESNIHISRFSHSTRIKTRY